MLVCPRCPSPLAGAPFIKVDHRVACWATENLSPSGLKAWLRLVTYFRNDRPIPPLSARRLARIAGLSLGTAHKVLGELRELLRFSDDEEVASSEQTAGDGVTSIPEIQSSHVERERTRPEQQRSALERELARDARHCPAADVDR